MGVISPDPQRGRGDSSMDLCLGQSLPTGFISGYGSAFGQHLSAILRENGLANRHGTSTVDDRCYSDYASQFWRYLLKSISLDKSVFILSSLQRDRSIAERPRDASCH